MIELRKTPRLMGIMDMFRTSTGGGVPAAPAPAPISAPAPAPIAAAPAEPEDPFKGFAEIWNPVDPTKTGAPKDLAAPLFDPVDPTKLQDTLKKVDFSRGLPAELRAKIAAGGEDAVAASLEAMNYMSRQTLAQSTMANTQMLEGMMGELSKRLEAKIDSVTRARSADEQIMESNPIFKNPAVSPLIMALRHQMITQHPEWSSKQVADALNTYAQNFAKAIQAPGIAQSNAKAAASDTSMDWEKFLTEGQQ